MQIYLPDDGSKDGNFELRSRDNTGSSISKLGNNKCTENFIEDDKGSLEDGRQFHNFSQDGEHAVEEEGSGNGNRVGVHGDGDGKFVEEDWNQDTSTSAGQAQVYELVGGGISWLEVVEDLASMHESVTEQAHVFLSLETME